jgi:hypothetical protein
MMLKNVEHDHGAPIAVWNLPWLLKLDDRVLRRRAQWRVDVKIAPPSVHSSRIKRSQKRTLATPVIKKGRHCAGILQHLYSCRSLPISATLQRADKFGREIRLIPWLARGWHLMNAPQLTALATPGHVHRGARRDRSFTASAATTQQRIRVAQGTCHNASDGRTQF